MEARCKMGIFNFGVIAGSAGVKQLFGMDLPLSVGILRFYLTMDPDDVGINSRNGSLYVATKFFPGNLSQIIQRMASPIGLADDELPSDANNAVCTFDLKGEPSITSGFADFKLQIDSIPPVSQTFTRIEMLGENNTGREVQFTDRLSRLEKNETDKFLLAISATVGVAIPLSGNDIYNHLMTGFNSDLVTTIINNADKLIEGFKQLVTMDTLRRLFPNIPLS